MFHSEYCEVKIIQTHLELYDLINKLKKTKVIYYDTETTGLRVRYPGEVDIVGWTFAVDDDIDERVFYIPVRHDFECEYELGRIDFEKLKLNPANFPAFDERDLLGNWSNVDADLVFNALKPILEGVGVERKILVAHNEMYDLHVLANEGIDVYALFLHHTIFDTMVALHTINEEAEKKLETVVEKSYGVVKCDFNDVVATVTGEEKKSVGLKANNKASFQHTQIPIGGIYSGEDVWFMKQIYPDLIEELEEDGQADLFYNSRMPFLQVLWNMERQGARVDIKRCKEMAEKAKIELDKIKYELFELSGVEFNINSGQQLAEIIFGHKKKLKDKKTGEYRESYNEAIVAQNFGFPVFEWTDGGKDKDKKLANPKTNADNLAELLKFTPSTKGKNKMSASQIERLETDGKALITLLLKNAKLEKLYTSFMIGLLDQVYADGKAHPSFNVCGTDSWRLSCDHPNLQQLPRPLEKPSEPKKEKCLDENGIPSISEYRLAMEKYKEEKAEYDFWIQFEIRDLFIADSEDEVIISADFSNLEKRITAHMTGDKNLIELLINGYDGHGFTATLIFEECHNMHPNDVKKNPATRPLRQIAKTVGFAMDYGGSSFTVSRNLGISREEAQGYIDKYFEGFSGLAEWATTQKKFGKANGYVTTLLGHKRHLNGMRSENMKTRSYNERLCLNSPVQGSAADITNSAQTIVYNDPVLRSIKCKTIIQVHDELVFSVKRKYVNLAMERIKRDMESALNPYGIKMIVPLIANVDFGGTYAEAK